MLTRVVDEGKLRGVYIPEIDEQATHGQFVDDTHVLIEAWKEFVEESFRVFRFMGNALGLFVKESEVKAICVADGPIPHELQALPFIWESKGNLSKLLGILIGQDISPQSMQTYLQEALEKRLTLAKRNPHSLMVRVQIANQVVDNVLWYMLQVWSDSPSFLEKLDDIVKDFI